MSDCPWEEQVWLFDELPTQQQAAVRAHVQECQTCGMIWHQAEAMKKIIRVLDPPQPEHAAALTHRVMNALPAPRKRAESWRWPRFSAAQALHATAVVLVLWFVLEHTGSTAPVAVHPHPANSVPLNTHAFVKKIYERKNKPQHSAWYARYQRLKKTSNGNYAELR